MKVVGSFFFIANTAMWALATAYMVAAARGAFGQTNPLTPLGIALVGIIVSAVMTILSWRETCGLAWLMVAETAAGGGFQLGSFKMTLYVA